jgi:phosphate starvation-inducible PhoH-like protein
MRNQPNRAAEKKTAEKARRRQERQEVREQVVRQPLELVWRTKAQSDAWSLLERNLITFLLGSAGSGKTFIAMAYAINAVLTGAAEKIVLTRPIVEAGERLGYLPGTFNEKVNPYMQPLYDAMETLVGKQSAKRELINKAVVLAPLCYMRGRTFANSICVFDEAQNATYPQLKLFLTRFGDNSRFVITGDPEQSDLPFSPPPLREVVTKLKGAKDIGAIQFAKSDVVRHPIVTTVLDRLP